MTSSKIIISFEITNCDFKMKKSSDVFYYLKNKKPIPLLKNSLFVGRSMISTPTEKIQWTPMGTLVQIQLNHHRNNPQSFFSNILKSSIGAIAGIGFFGNMLRVTSYAFGKWGRQFKCLTPYHCCSQGCPNLSKMDQKIKSVGRKDREKVTERTKK